MPQLRPKKIPNMQKLLFSKESEKRVFRGWKQI
jgi:hypothetical protein